MLGLIDQPAHCRFDLSGPNRWKLGIALTGQQFRQRAGAGDGRRAAASEKAHLGNSAFAAEHGDPQLVATDGILTGNAMGRGFEFAGIAWVRKMVEKFSAVQVSSIFADSPSGGVS